METEKKVKGTCDECILQISREVIPFYRKHIVPASKRAYEKTKYDFHAGYNKACTDMLKRFDSAMKGQLRDDT